MTPEGIKSVLASQREYFNRSTRPLEEQHAGYAPKAEMITVAGQVAHVAQTIEWFFDSAFAGEWRMDFEEMDRQVRSVRSLSEAKAWFERAIDRAIEVAGSHTAEEWAALFPPNPIIGEVPRFAIVGAVTDHTAHHRGALTVYQRLLGLTPLMPYMEM
jgi:uncharacterized damage-inducible protein DinB